jgi:hypothetical protein
MFDQFVLIILQVLTLYSPAHLKLHSHLESLKLHLRLWIHLYVDPRLRQSTRIYKFTKLPDFAYSSSFTSFLASIHCLSMSSSYKKAILDPL